MVVEVLEKKRNKQGDVIYSLELDGCPLTFTVRYHLCRRSADRWASLGIWGVEAIAEFMREIICDDNMADYVLFGVYLDGREHKHMVLDLKRGLIYTMIVQNDTVTVSTVLFGAKGTIWYDADDTLLVVKKDGTVCVTSGKEYPDFVKKNN